MRAVLALLQNQLTRADLIVAAPMVENATILSRKGPSLAVDSLMAMAQDEGRRPCPGSSALLC